jgi:NADH:ubiquinone reductase (H+-translocating)
MKAAHPIKIVIVGNGFGGVYALKNLHKLFHDSPDVHITLVGETNFFLFTPLLHEVATGSIHPENIVELIHKVIDCCLDDFHQGRVESVNLDEHTVTLGDKVLSYDYLVLAPGAETDFYNIPGAEEYTLPLKSLEDAIAIKNRLIDQIERASYISDRDERKKQLSYVIVGGGPTGVELAAEITEFVKDTFRSYYPKDVIEDISITLIQRAGELMPQFSPVIRAKSLTVLERKGVRVLLGRAVSKVTDSSIEIDGTETLPASIVIWVAGVKPANIKFNREVGKDHAGKLIVDQYLALPGANNVFAIGDLASFVPEGATSPLPALAQVAVRQAKTAARNIERSVKGKPLQSFKYSSLGSLVSLGRWMAVGEVKNLHLSGDITWLIWRMVYLSKMISWQKKLKVAIDWTFDFFSPRDISRL